MASFADPRRCLRDFLQTGRNLGRRPPSFSLRNLQRDIRSVKTRIENVKDRVEGAIGAVARGEFSPGQFLSITNEFRCPPTAYANYFGQHRPPKFKFMFFVEFKLNADFNEAFGLPWFPSEMWWFIKQSGRPNVNYEYEDVNMYNFRQKVLRRAVLNPVTIKMYDDLQDSSASFWNAFLRIQSPVTSMYPTSTQNMFENYGMNWDDIEKYKENLKLVRSARGESIDNRLNYSASTGVLPNASSGRGIGVTQLIKEINVYHLIDWGRKYVRYEYVNPRINSINFDELTWESSDPNVIDVEFEYDTFHIHFPLGVTDDLLQNGALPNLYPITPNMDETPLDAVNTGIDKFNTGFHSAYEAVNEAAKQIPGFGNVIEF